MNLANIDTAAAIDRMRTLVREAGVSDAELEQAELDQRDPGKACSLVNDQAELARLGAPVYDPEWRQAGLSARDMTGRTRFVYRLCDVPVALVNWAVTYRAARVVLAIQNYVAGEDHDTALEAARHRVWAVAH